MQILAFQILLAVMDFIDLGPHMKTFQILKELTSDYPSMTMRLLLIVQSFLSLAILQGSLLHLERNVVQVILITYAR